MKQKLSFGAASLFICCTVSAQSLYDVGTEALGAQPIKWVVGGSMFYDNNVNAGYSGAEQGSFGISPTVGMSYASTSPQTTWDINASLGLIYYFDAPENVDSTNSQSRLGFNLTHRFDERLRFSSQNFVSYELAPDYSTGYTSSAQTGETFYWSTDNSVGYRWNEVLGTYTGFKIYGIQYADSDNGDNNQINWELYNQWRFQVGPQTVATGDYRYNQSYGGGDSSNYVDQFFLIGAEHRFTQNTLGVIRAGVQLHDVSDGQDYTSPYLEFAFNSQINKELKFNSYARYGIQGIGNVQFDNTAGLVEYNDTKSLRLGVSANYTISPMFAVFGGVDYLPTSYQGGESLETPAYTGSITDLDQNLINANIGLSVQFTEKLTGTLSYNFTNSSSDIQFQDYNRSRINLGLTAEF
jgi:hypothetical protein